MLRMPGSLRTQERKRGQMVLHQHQGPLVIVSPCTRSTSRTIEVNNGWDVFALAIGGSAIIRGREEIYCAYCFIFYYSITTLLCLLSAARLEKFLPHTFFSPPAYFCLLGRQLSMSSSRSSPLMPFLHSEIIRHALSDWINYHDCLHDSACIHIQIQYHEIIRTLRTK